MKKLRILILLIAVVCSSNQTFARDLYSPCLNAGTNGNENIEPKDTYKKDSKISRDASSDHTWGYIGAGMWSDPFYRWTADKTQCVFDIEIEECMEHAGELRIIINNDNDNFEAYPIVHCNDPEKVYINEYTYFRNGNVDLNASQRCKENGWSSNYFYGQMAGNIIHIPANAFRIYLNNEWQIPSYVDNCKIVLPEGYTPQRDSSVSGVYFGITAFNYLPEIMPLNLLTTQNKQKYKDFVNSRTTDDYTYLYYSAEKALDELKRRVYPRDLSSVTLITFTDGNDDGSLEMAPDKTWDDIAYQNYVEGLITDAYVQGIKVDAYSIGLKGNDIGDYNYEMFKSNLKALATEPKEKHATEVEKMNEVESTLNYILDNLETSWLNKKVSCSINMRATGDKIRFTLDKSREAMDYNPENSDVWIEGIFSRDDNSMNNVVYHGCISSSGEKVDSKKVVIEGKTKYQFTFENLKDLNGDHLNTGEIHFWHATNTNPIWQPHTEFGQGSGAETEFDRSSAAIMFVMDCSSSLGDDFGELKRVINDLIERLASGSDNSSTVQLVNDDNCPIEYYNLQGIRVINPTNGIFIEKKGSKVRKVLF